MAMTTLKIPYGLDSSGRIVHVDDVPRGKACGARCASCGSELVAKKGDSGKVIHHFAHYQSNGHSCEGWLHSTAKAILAQRITDSMAGKAPFPIKWACPREELKCVHEADLLGKGFIGNIPVEQHRSAYQMGLPGLGGGHEVDLEKAILNNIRVEKLLSTWNIRPDITLMAGDTPMGLIEVVDTHPPEPPVIDAGLPVLEVHVSEPAHLNVLAESATPVAVMHNYPCPDPICDLCGRRKSSGCLHCGVCRRHVTPEHHHCGVVCKACTDRKHYHANCSNCGVIVAQGEYVYTAKWRGTHWEEEVWLCRPCSHKPPKYRTGAS